MPHDKLITVLGATGTQGGAVARALLADGEFGVRAVTRDAASSKARSLAELGADVVEADLTDIGQAVLHVLRRPAETIGATVPVASEHLTGEQIAAALGTVIGEPVAYRPPTHHQVRSLGFPGAAELGNMFQYYTEFPESYLGRRDLDAARTVNPHPLSLTDFLAAHRAELEA
jgi:uncharacterized protein YbjT (DUF2867 family)